MSVQVIIPGSISEDKSVKCPDKAVGAARTYLHAVHCSIRRRTAHRCLNRPYHKPIVLPRCPEATMGSELGFKECNLSGALNFCSHTQWGNLGPSNQLAFSPNLPSFCSYRSTLFSPNPTDQKQNFTAMGKTSHAIRIFCLECMD
jgi:hypothetical protein